MSKFLVGGLYTPLDEILSLSEQVIYESDGNAKVSKFKTFINGIIRFLKKIRDVIVSAFKKFVDLIKGKKEETPEDVAEKVVNASSSSDEKKETSSSQPVHGEEKSNTGADNGSQKTADTEPKQTVVAKTASKTAKSDIYNRQYEITGPVFKDVPNNTGYIVSKICNIIDDYQKGLEFANMFAKRANSSDRSGDDKKNLYYRTGRSLNDFAEEIDDQIKKNEKDADSNIDHLNDLSGWLYKEGTKISFDEFKKVIQTRERFVKTAVEN